SDCIQLFMTLFCSHTLMTYILYLFPYTTLFRSDFQFFFEAGITENLDLEVARGGRLRPEHIARKTVQDNRLELFVLGIPRGDHQDRKSTRLNSSHVKISYAVFCLKKKIRQCKLE